jgi:hypothetical protein
LGASRSWRRGSEKRRILSELVPAMEDRGYDTGAVKALIGG